MAKKTQEPEILPPENQGQELAIFPKLNLPTVTSLTEEMRTSFGTMYTRIEEGISKLPTDMSIKKNRDEVASYAYSISRTKTGLDKAAVGTVEDAKTIVDAVNVERKNLKTELDMLRDKAREKLDAWEARVEKQENETKREVAQLGRFVEDLGDGVSAATMESILAELLNRSITEERYGEGLQSVISAHLDAVEKMDLAIARQKKQEIEAAELEQFRKEKAEREAAAKLEAENKEKADAAERDRLYREAEEKRIAEQAKLEAQREAELKIAQEKERADKAEREQKEAIEKAERDAKEATARAAEAEARAEREKEAAITAEREASTRREQEAARREREKIEEEKAEERRQALAKERADQERAADIAHRKKLNGEALTALVKACELTDKQAMAVIIAIYKEQIPHVLISY